MKKSIFKIERNFIYFLLLFFITTGTVMYFNSCTKDDEFATTESSRESKDIRLRHSQTNTFSPDDSVTGIILGEKAPCNPYTVEIVTQAWNNLYPDNSVSVLPASHRYVKFTPDTEEDIYRLYEDPELTVWDYPLDYEVIKMGDYYTQPGKGDSDLPDLYSVVDINYDFDLGVAYEELEQLIKVPYNSMLSAETFRLCNLDHIKVKRHIDPSTGNPPTDDPPIIDCNPECPNYPCCFIEGVSCDEEVNSITNAICGDIVLPTCNPGDPNWPDCLDIDFVDPNDDSQEYCICYEYESLDGDDEPTGYSIIIPLPEGQNCEDQNYQEADSYYICETYTPPPPPPPPTNNCGCTRYLNTRKPAGCVNVQNATNDGYVGVNNAKVIIKNHHMFNYNITDWFGLLWAETTHTDENGCWKLNKACYGKIYMWVQFKNEDAYIRSPNFSASASFSSGIDIDGNPLNYIQPVTDYVGGISGPNFSNIQVNYNRWVQGAQEGTQTQRYWSAAQTVNAVADMHDMCNDEGINTPPHIDVYITEDQTGAAWMAHYGGVLNIASNLVGLIPGITSMALLPDIILDRNEDVDDYRGTAFHEMSHASHFTNVGAEWWQVLTQTEYENEGHGDGNEPNAGYVAVAESWADHIGELFDMGNPAGYIIDLDRNDFEPANLPITPWIPWGLHYDLYDNVEINWGINDNISGFTNEMIFDILDANTQNINDIENNLWNEYNAAPGVSATPSDYQLLFDSYGF